MFLIDKYGLYAEKNTMLNYDHTKKDQDLLFHTDAIKMMSIMAKDESMPHIICYGPEGSGKKTIIKKFLELIYGNDVNKVKDTIYNVTGSGNNVTEVVIKQSNYHIIIEPNNDNRDRYLIHDVVKEYARRMPLHNLFSENKCFKTVVINNLGNLSYYGQTSLRRTMEKYSDTCRFIMWSHSLSNVIEPLRSRCYCFRIVPPDMFDIHKLIYLVCGHEKIKISLADISRISKECQGDIKRALWLLDMYRHGYSNTEQYDVIIGRIGKLISLGEFSKLQQIRDLMYTLIISNIQGTKIMISLMENLLGYDTDYLTKSKIIEKTVFYEHRMASARREIMQLDCLVISLMRVFRDGLDKAK